MRGYFDLVTRLGVPISVLAGAWAYRTAQRVVRRWGTGSVRGWPTVDAVIDVVSVAGQIREGGYGSATTTGYLATLTYFYRDSELRMGEYSRSFPLEEAARRWAEGFKNKHVLVHVNPKDPSDSVLMKNDLEGLGNGLQPSLEDSLRVEGLPQLKQGYLVLAGASEFISLIGLTLTGAAAWMHMNHRATRSIVVTLVVMALIDAATAWIVSYRADDSHRLQSLLHSYTLFCPAWMRWSVRVTGGLLFAAWVAIDLRDLLPLQAQHWMSLGLDYWFYLVASWVFMSTGATHAAMLRSQEFARRPSVADVASASGDSSA